MPLGALVGGALATRFGVRTTIWAGAAGCWAAALWVVLSPLLRMRDFDADEIA
jgi:predicted MFS family arabinose efflux permease